MHSIFSEPQDTIEATQQLESEGHAVHTTSATEPLQHFSQSQILKMKWISMMTKLSNILHTMIQVINMVTK